MRIVIDNKEQQPYSFTGQRYAGTIIEPGTLPTGDYSLSGLADRVAVERKSLDDLVACLSRERERFVRELERAKALDFFAVVCECTWANITGGNYRSQLNSHAASQSLLSFMSKYGYPIIFAGNRDGAEYATHGLLRHYLQGVYKRLAAIQKAHGGADNSSGAT